LACVLLLVVAASVTVLASADVRLSRRLENVEASSRNQAIELAAVKREVSAGQADSLAGRVSTLELGATSIRGDVGGLKSEVANLKARVDGLAIELRSKPTLAQATASAVDQVKFMLFLGQMTINSQALQVPIGCSQQVAVWQIIGGLRC
jgi:hypothetical protein